MKQVDVILSGSINAIIGPVGTLKRILKNQDYFNSRGYDVTVFTSDSIHNGPIKIPPSPNETPTVHHSKIRRRVSSILRNMAKKNICLAKWFLDREKKRVEALINYYVSLNREPDIVQFHSGEECRLFLEKRKSSNAKTIMFMHSDGVPFKMTLEYYPCLEGSKYLRKGKKTFDWAVENTNKVCFIAKKGQENFLKYYPNKSKDETCLIINGIDDFTVAQWNEIESIKEKYRMSEFKYRLCCTGTINYRKGQRIIIDAMHKMPEDILRQTHLDLFGDGGERFFLEKLVKEYGLDKHVSFYGMIPNNKVYRYLAQNNIYILMSKNEGLPISIIEAMRAGLPVISTNVSGIPELVNVGYNGFLLEPNAGALERLLSKLPEFDWAQMGCNSRKRYVDEFTFERMKKEFCDMYDSLLV